MADTSLPTWSCPKKVTSVMVLMIDGLVINCTSGDSSFATCLTSSNPIVAVPLGGTVTVDEASHSYGTSRPCVLRPSERTYLMWMRVIVTALFDVGDRKSTRLNSS